MIFEESFNLFKRFLKEDGIYIKAMKIYDHEPWGEIGKMSIKDRFKHMSPVRWLTSENLFCDWSKSKEGRKFWFKKNILWKILLCEKECMQNCDIKEIIKDYCEEFKCDAETEFGDKLKLLDKK